MLDVISLGAGKQSSYMLLTALEGKYKYKPEFAIFSDTGCEPEYVMTYIDWLKIYVKEKYDFDIITVTGGNILKDTLDYVAGNKSRVATIPLRLGKSTKTVFDEEMNSYYNIEVGGGLIMRQCTNDYKIAPLRRYLQKVRHTVAVRLWIGISLDEQERQKQSNVNYIEHYYPLVENRIKIDGIIQWFKDNKLPEPGKSACLICPFHSDNYWKVFKKQFPNEFETACKFDDAIRVYPNLNQKASLQLHSRQIPKVSSSDSRQSSIMPRRESRSPR